MENQIVVSFLDPKNVHFKMNLHAKAIPVTPQTIGLVITIGKFIYDSLIKKKENPNEEIGEWFYLIDKKLDQILIDLSDIKKELKRIEELIIKIPFALAEDKLDTAIQKYYLNVSTLNHSPKEAKNSPFSEIYNEVQSAFVTIIGAQAFPHLYKLILGFIIQIEILNARQVAGDYTKDTRKKLIEFLISFLNRSLDPNTPGSFRFILNTHLNSLTKLEGEFIANDAYLRRFFIIGIKKTPPHKGEPGDWEASIARVGYNYSIQGNVRTGFTHTKTFVEPHEHRTTYDSNEVKDLQRLEETKSTIQSDIESIFGRYQNGHQLYVEIEKNADYYKKVIQHVEEYIEKLNEMHDAILTEPVENLN